ncbi:MAG: DUF1553 domain-containing protein, partial [Verrucomicrobiota bacterium]|nr:DUF1553 domain-containing protein [Verrucomicrobiota bacterium]
FSRTYLFQPDTKKPALLGERAEGEAVFTSVFTKVGGTARPRLPGGEELADPAIAPAEAWVVPPNPKDKNVRAIPKFSRRAQLAAALTDGRSPEFRRNIANRLWYMMFGRGLVEPLDVQHSANPPAHPALLDLLAEAIAGMKFDMKAFIRELALTRAFQRSVDLPDAAPELARAAAERLPRIEQEAKALAATAAASEETFIRARDAVRQAALSAEPLTAELKKQEAAVAPLQKAADAAAAAEKKSSEVLAAKQEVHKTLAEAGLKANEAAASDPDTPKLTKAAKTAETKANQAARELPALEKDLETKKKDADAKAQALIAAQQIANAARASVDEAARHIATLQGALDLATKQKQSDRIKARHTARRASETKALVAWAEAADADRAARDEASRAEAALAVANQA